MRSAIYEQYKCNLIFYISELQHKRSDYNFTISNNSDVSLKTRNENKLYILFIKILGNSEFRIIQINKIWKLI